KSNALAKEFAKQRTSLERRCTIWRCGSVRAGSSKRFAMVPPFFVSSATGERKTMKTQVLHSTTGLLAMLAFVVWSGSVSAHPQPAPGGPGGAAPGGPPRPPPLLMTTTAFEDGGIIPDKYTQAGGPMSPSPELKWSQVPMGTQSFVLLMHDPEPV